MTLRYSPNCPCIKLKHDATVSIQSISPNSKLLLFCPLVSFMCPMLNS